MPTSVDGFEIPAMTDAPNLPNAFQTLVQALLAAFNYQDRDVIAVSEADFTSGSETTVVTYSGSALQVPAWAQDGLHTVVLMVIVNALIITDPGQFILHANLFGTDGPPSATAGNVGTVSESGGFTVGGVWTIPASTTALIPSVTAFRSTGTGALRINNTDDAGAIIWDVVIK